MQQQESIAPVDESAPAADAHVRVPAGRTAVAGVLMGLANLVPGVSGGTMVVVMGLYDEFVSAVADVTKFKFRRQHIVFLAILVFSAAVAIFLMSGPLKDAVANHRSAMFSLFIGMTLGGVPMLWSMLRRWSASAAIGAVAGLAVMTLIGLSHMDRPDSAAVREAAAAGTFVVQPAYGTDFLAGVLGMSAMVLPGISGAYMLLIIGRYETILASVALCKEFLASGGGGDALVFLRVLVPAGLGAVISLVLLSNLLKWLLRHYFDCTIGVLLGVLCGSPVGIWPFTSSSTGSEIAIGAGLAVAGLVVTVALGRLAR